ncbi:phospholipase A2 inhibitor and Ly6/PLAUR domain-containing protein-like [Lacerta agilis]|uniref:phospholipase A2 inhibitor and Ly6/PLAUR domain-containing protein-like n=1 Tax=Lacerta agilis TaxID=80427 RepID=UPI001419918B|nr:phospholipase A2 inhibitor and Ly6/PLAUR domain-containing protein-like [Lacerta agilis]
MKVLLGTSLLLVIVSPAVPLKCISATDITKVSDQRVLTCRPSLNVCFSSVFRTNIVGDKEATYYGCGLAGLCRSGHYSFTSASGTFVQKISRCCNTDMCNNETLTLPDRSTLPPNGLKCPACFHYLFRNCTSKTTINCFGNENQCVHFKGVLKKGIHRGQKLNFKGCATKDFCSLKNHSPFVGYYNFEPVEETCYDASETSNQPEF